MHRAVSRVGHTRSHVGLAWGGMFFSQFFVAYDVFLLAAPDRAYVLWWRCDRGGRSETAPIGENVNEWAKRRENEKQSVNSRAGESGWTELERSRWDKRDPVLGFPDGLGRFISTLTASIHSLTTHIWSLGSLVTHSSLLVTSQWPSCHSYCHATHVTADQRQTNAFVPCSSDNGMIRSNDVYVHIQGLLRAFLKRPCTCHSAVFGVLQSRFEMPFWDWRT